MRRAMVLVLGRLALGGLALGGLAGAAGCAFQPGGTLDDGDGGRIDAAELDGPAATVDTAIDAAPVLCQLKATAIPTSGGPVVGSTAGGTDRPVLRCADDELPIGFAFDVSSGNISNHGNQPVMVAATLRCARLVATDGSYVTTLTTTTTQPGFMGGGNCGPYAPTNPSAETVCPTGTVLVGLGFNRPLDVLFNNVSLRCAPVHADGSLDPAVTGHPVGGTGAFTNMLLEGVCPTGTAVVAVAPKSACGIDGLTLRCAPLACSPS